MNLRHRMTSSATYGSVWKFLESFLDRNFSKSHSAFRIIIHPNDATGRPTIRANRPRSVPPSDRDSHRYGYARASRDASRGPTHRGARRAAMGGPAMGSCVKLTPRSAGRAWVMHAAHWAGAQALFVAPLSPSQVPLPVRATERATPFRMSIENLKTFGAAGVRRLGARPRVMRVSPS